MLNGLDLFSGIGGLSIALSPWVQPVAYCEIERYAQAVLLSRMSEGQIAVAPICTDIRNLRGGDLPKIDIIYGGFPCQDISVANQNGKGLEGKRSGLFYEIMRLVDEIRPRFIFLENVPNIITRGLSRVVGELTSRGYDCRWKIISAHYVGARHLRRRFWLLAHFRGKPMARSNEQIGKLSQEENRQEDAGLSNTKSDTSNWEASANEFYRNIYGVPTAVDRIKGLGNAVVPLQARKAFEILSGIGGSLA